MTTKKLKELVQMKTYGRKWFTRWVAACIAVVLGMGMCAGLPVSATQSRKQNFSTNYTLTGNGATDILNVALAQQGKTGSQLGYTEEWCADFVSDCADLAGQSDAVPRYGGVDGLKTRILNAGGVEVSSPQPGDIVFFSGHVEIVYSGSGSSLKSIGGNTSSAGNLYARKVSSPRVHGGSYTVVRPNYKGINPDPNPPTVSNISIDKALYAVGENVAFHVSSDKATGYLIGIYRNGERVDTTASFSESIYNYTPTTAGDYSAYVTSYNSVGYVDSALVYFSVYDSKPVTSFLKTDKSSYSVGETIKFTIESDNAVNYAIGIYKDNERIDSIASDTNEVSYTITTAGNYSAYVTSSNAFGYLDSNRNDCHFNVYDSKPKISVLKTNKSKYLVGETVKFVIESDNAVNYAIGIYRDNERIDSIASDAKEVSYTITKAGNYSAYVTSSNDFGYLDSNRNDCHFYVYSSEQEMTHNGDLNSDNTLTTADAVLLQRYILGEKSLTQSQWQAADLNADGVVNGFDLALLRQKLTARA